MSNNKLVVFGLLLILCFSFLVDLPTVKSNPNSGNETEPFVVNIEKLSFPITVQYYHGVLYGASETGDNKFFKSTDYGETWTAISTLIGTPRQSAPFFIDTQGNFFLYITHNDTIIKSSELGVTWTTVFDFTANGYPAGTTSMSMGFTEDDQTNLYFGVYGNASSSHVWKSVDHGNSWNLIYDFNARHIHALQFNPYNRALYASVGDGGAIPFMGNYKSTDYGRTWTKLTLGEYKTASILFTANFTYWGSDVPTCSQAFIARSQDDTNFTESYLLGSSLGVEWINDLAISPETGVLHATATGTTENGIKGIWASADNGETWIPIYTVNDTTGTSYHFAGISNFADGYWFIQQCQAPCLTLKLKDLTKDQVRQLGSKLQKQTIQDQYLATSSPLINSIGYLNFMQNPSQNARLRFVGVSFRQLVRNPSFEEGALGQIPTYWSRVNYAGNNWSVVKNDTDRQFGNYSMAICGMNTTAAHGEIQQNYNSAISSNSSIMVMYYVKIANENNFRFKFQVTTYYTDGTTYSGIGYTTRNESTNGWATIRFAFTFPKNVNGLLFRFQIGGQGIAWVDGLLVGLIDGDSANVIRNLSWNDDFLNNDVNGRLINTTNPSIVIKGQAISYNGQLGNGSLTDYYSILNDLTGLEEVQIACEGSKVFRIIISGLSVSTSPSPPPTLGPSPSPTPSPTTVGEFDSSTETNFLVVTLIIILTAVVASVSLKTKTYKTTSKKSSTKKSPKRKKDTQKLKTTLQNLTQPVT